MKHFNTYFIYLLILGSWSSIILGEELQGKNEIKVDFEKCPKNPSSDFVFKASKIFEEKNESLNEVKKYIVSERLKEKYFLSHYKVDYDPLKRTLSFYLFCSPPALKVSALSSKGDVSYDIILSEDGKTHDPSYLVYLKSDGLTHMVPKAAISSELLTQQNKEELVLLARKVQGLTHTKLREMIYNDQGEMTMLVGEDKKITSVFLGQGFWEKKLDKLDKIMSYMEVKNKLPSQVNLVDINKVVVKF